MMIGRMNEMNMRPIIVASISLLLAGLVAPAWADGVASLIKQLGAWSNDKAKRASDELAAMGKPVVSQVAEALSSRSRRRGRFAARTLRQIGPDAAEAIPALFESLKDPDALTREYAVEALAQMTRQAERVIPMLQQAANDGDEDVSEKARLAISRLTEALESPETIEPGPQPSPETPSTDTAARPNRPDPVKSPAALEAAPSERESLLDRLTAIVVIRIALIAFIPLGFFLLLYLYREPR